VGTASRLARSVPAGQGRRKAMGQVGRQEKKGYEAGKFTGADLEAVKVLVDHQRRDIGGCICGWGVDTGDLGRSHSLHIWQELQREVLPARDARVRAPYQNRITALEDLLAHYRAGSRPPEALHRRLEQTRAALQDTN
jgi:hypothetical protein